MASEPTPERGGGAGSVRLFLALELPEAGRTAVARWRDAVVGGREELRSVATEALHVTLIFLGRRPSELVPELWDVVGGALAGLAPPSLAPAGLVEVPPRRPRLLALDLEDRGGKATAVHGALGDALAKAELYEPEARAFWPHVTLARVRGRSRLGHVNATPPATPFRAPGLTLYRSDLHPSGARYVALERLELGPPERR